MAKRTQSGKHCEYSEMPFYTLVTLSAIEGSSVELLLILGFILLLLFSFQTWQRRGAPTKPADYLLSLQNDIRQEIHLSSSELNDRQKLDFLSRAACVRFLYKKPWKPPSTELLTALDDAEFYQLILQWAMKGPNEDSRMVEKCWKAVGWISMQKCSPSAIAPASIVQAVSEEVLLQSLQGEQERPIHGMPSVFEHQIISSQARRIFGYLVMLGILKEDKDGSVALVLANADNAVTDADLPWKERFIMRLLLLTGGAPDEDEDHDTVHFAVQSLPTFMIELRQYSEVSDLLANVDFVRDRFDMMGVEDAVSQHISDLQVLIESTEQGLVALPGDFLENACSVLALGVPLATGPCRTKGIELHRIARFLSQHKSCEMIWKILDEARHYHELALHDSFKSLANALHSTGILYHMHNAAETSKRFLDASSMLGASASLETIREVCELMGIIQFAAETYKALSLYNERLVGCVQETLSVLEELTQIQQELGCAVDEEQHQIMKLLAESIANSS